MSGDTGVMIALIGLVSLSLNYFVKKSDSRALENTKALLKVAEATARAGEAYKEQTKTGQYLAKSLDIWAKSNEESVESGKVTNELVEKLYIFMQMSHEKNAQIYEFMLNLNGKFKKVAKEKIQEADEQHVEHQTVEDK